MHSMHGFTLVYICICSHFASSHFANFGFASHSAPSSQLQLPAVGSPPIMVHLQRPSQSSPPMLHLSSCSQDPPHTDGLQIPPDVYLWESPTGLFPWPEFDPPPVMMNSPAAQPVYYEPQEGWKVGAWWYFTDHRRDGHWGLPANVFLAENSSGRKMGLSFWKYCTPTAYHGDWEHGRSTVYMRFNARGPRHDPSS